jgi:tetratricopeptide (TPR) repeat protein
VKAFRHIRVGLRRAWFPALALLVMAAMPAWSASVEEILALFDAGHFEKTMSAGRAEGSQAGLLLATRAELVLIQYIYEPERRQDAIEHAIADARKAFAMDPSKVEAMINLGVAVGLRGRLDRSMSDGKEARNLFEHAVALEPHNSWALGVLATWHGETVHEAGFLAARMFMGAKKKTSFALFEQALAEDPDNLPIRASYIRTLLKLKPDEFADTVAANVRALLAQPPRNALDRILQEQIRRIEAARERGDEAALEQLLDEAVPLCQALPCHGQGN